MISTVDGLLQAVGVTDTDKCLRWAFGKGCSADTPLYTLDELWNKEHPDLFQLRGHDAFAGSIMRIGEEYLRSLKQDENTRLRPFTLEHTTH